MGNESDSSYSKRRSANSVYKLCGDITSYFLLLIVSLGRGKEMKTDERCFGIFMIEKEEEKRIFYALVNAFLVNKFLLLPRNDLLF